MNSIIKPVRPDYNTCLRFLEELTKEFPFLDTEIQGRSALGRGIFSFSIGNVKKTSLIVGGFNGSDTLTPLLLMLFTERLCRSVKYSEQLCGIQIKQALSKVGVTVIPCLNPDGMQIAAKGFEAAKSLRLYLSDISPEGHADWNANAFGVNISRNFGKGREEYRQREYENGTFAPSSDGYCGEHAESEAETRVLTRLCRLRGFSRCLSVSDDGSGLCLYTDEGTPACASMMGKIVADSCACSFRGGEADSAATFYRWFGQELSRPAFSLGLGDKSRLTYEDLYRAYDRVEEALLLFLLM